MHLKVEIIVKGGKKGEPISHWRQPGSLLVVITSLRQRIRIVVSMESSAFGIDLQYRLFWCSIISIRLFTATKIVSSPDKLSSTSITPVCINVGTTFNLKIPQG